MYGYRGMGVKALVCLAMLAIVAPAHAKAPRSTADIPASAGLPVHVPAQTAPRPVATARDRNQAVARCGCSAGASRFPAPRLLKRRAFRHPPQCVR